MGGRLFEGGVFSGTYGTGMWAHVHTSCKYSISGRQIVRSEICSYSFLQHVLSAGVLTYTFTYSSCSNTYFTLLLLETCTSPLYVLRYFCYYYHMKHSNRGVVEQELQYKSKLTKRKKEKRRGTGNTINIQ